MTKAMYETLFKRLSDASLIRNVGGYDLEAIERPSLGKKVSPSAKICLALGLFLGACLGFGLSFLMELRGETQRPHPSNLPCSLDVRPTVTVPA
jgi:uncharacterized protein involved in exopolysaccharide biosynthesis